MVWQTETDTRGFKDFTDYDDKSNRVKRVTLDHKGDVCVVNGERLSNSVRVEEFIRYADVSEKMVGAMKEYVKGMESQPKGWADRTRKDEGLQK